MLLCTEIPSFSVVFCVGWLVWNLNRNPCVLSLNNKPGCPWPGRRTLALPKSRCLQVLNLGEGRVSLFHKHLKSALCQLYWIYGDIYYSIIHCERLFQSTDQDTITSFRLSCWNKKAMKYVARNQNNYQNLRLLKIFSDMGLKTAGLLGWFWISELFSKGFPVSIIL